MLNTKPLCVLPLHVWDRELDVRLLLAMFAVKQQYPTIIGHEYNLQKVYQNIPGIFYYGCGRPIMSSRVTDWQSPILENGGRVSLVFEEGLVTYLPVMHIKVLQSNHKLAQKCIHGLKRTY